MMESQLSVKEQQDALIIYKYLLLYNEFENVIKEKFEKGWKEIDSTVKNRIAYYVGWLGSEVKYIEYDTYTIKLENHPYSEEMMLKKLTVNQIIRIDRVEKAISRFDFEVESRRQKLTFLSHDCFLAFVKMRNKLAHDILKIKFNSGDTIEILPYSKIVESKIAWIDSITEQQLSDLGQAILSNYIFMVEIIDTLRKEV